MKSHHEFFHAYETVKKYNYHYRNILGCLSFLKDQSTDGTVLNKTLAELKAIIVSTLQFIQADFPRIKVFINGHENYDLLIHSNRALNEIVADDIKILSFTPTAINAVSAANINNKAKLAAISMTNPLISCSPVAMFPSMRYLGILNDLLDASSYVLHGINPDDGTVLPLTDDQKKARVVGYLNQFVNFITHPWPFEFQGEVTLMVTVKDYILSNLNSISLNDLGTYIDTNITKLPLIRRSWAIG